MPRFRRCHATILRFIIDDTLLFFRAVAMMPIRCAPLYALRLIYADAAVDATRYAMMLPLRRLLFLSMLICASLRLLLLPPYTLFRYYDDTAPCFDTPHAFIAFMRDAARCRDYATATPTPPRRHVFVFCR